MPPAPSAPSPSRLLFSQYDSALRLSRMSQFQRHAIRRVHPEEMVDALPEQVALQPLPQHIRGKNVRHLLQKIACSRRPLHSPPDFAHPLPPLPPPAPSAAHPPPPAPPPPNTPP